MSSLVFVENIEWQKHKERKKGDSAVYQYLLIFVKKRKKKKKKGKNQRQSEEWARYGGVSLWN